VISVVMSDHNRSSVQGGLEELGIGGQLHLASPADFWVDEGPHVGYDYDVLQRFVSTKFSEHVEVTTRDASHSWIGDTMDKDDSIK